MPFRAKPLHFEPIPIPTPTADSRWGALVRVLARVGARLRDAEKANGASTPSADAPSPPMQQVHHVPLRTNTGGDFGDSR